MSTTSKSPKKVATAALRVAARALPLYAHQFSPKKFTQPQLFACLVLKTIFKTDYRGILTSIPPTSGSPPKNLPRNYYRRLMATEFDSKAYRQRWQIETVFSMIKGCTSRK